MAFVNIQSEFDGTVIRLVINNPKGNVFTIDVANELERAVVRVSKDPLVKLITLEGAGENFSFGASVHEHTPKLAPAMLTAMRKMLWCICCNEVPVAALVQGKCLGGGFEAVLACHFAFAATNASMGLPEIRLGVVAPFAASLLPRKVTQAVADRLVISGEEMTSDQLREQGLVYSCHSADALWDGFQDWYNQTFATYSASAVRHATRHARAAFLRRLERRLEEAEKDYLDVVMKSYDAHEGVQAFIEKRAPVWKHS